MPFQGLKISKYVEFLTCLSSEYFTSSVLPSLTSTAGKLHTFPWLTYYIYHWARLNMTISYFFMPSIPQMRTFSQMILTITQEGSNGQRD